MPSKSAKFHQEGISSSEIRDTLESQFGGERAFWDQNGYLAGLTDLLELLRPKGYLRTVGLINNYIHTYSLTHSILRWKRVLVYLVPGLQHVLALIERLYRYACLCMFEIFDGMHKWPHKHKNEAI